MARIRRQNTEPERNLQERLERHGLPLLQGVKTPAGTPDLVVPTVPLALFIDGCFWHGCPEHYVRPRTRQDYWDAKLYENVARDRRQTLELEALGWKVLRIWEHEIYEALEEVVVRVLRTAGALTPADANRGSDTGGLEQRDGPYCVTALLVGESPELPAWRVLRIIPLDTDGKLERRVLIDLSAQARMGELLCERHTRKFRRPGRSRGDHPP